VTVRKKKPFEVTNNIAFTGSFFPLSI